MSRAKWDLVESGFDQLRVRPVVAVIPENKHEVLNYDAPDPEFWGKVRRWKEKGWAIAMHGYTHAGVPISGHPILPVSGHNEFAGLPYQEQAQRIRESWGIFREHELTPAVWIAPGHCFDTSTLRALRDETEIRIISDGIAFEPYYEHGLHWLPQQLWWPAERFSGIWTVCLHPNTMSFDEIGCLIDLLEQRYHDRIIALDNVVFTKRPRTLASRAYNFVFWKRAAAVRWLLAKRHKLPFADNVMRVRRLTMQRMRGGRK
jgi:hypothetical protein